MVRTRAILLALILILHAGVQAEWIMFGGDANHTGVAELTERTIQKREPTISWDRGSSSEEVYSWGTSIGNFTPNIDGDFYDENDYKKLFETKYDTVFLFGIIHHLLRLGIQNNILTIFN